MKNVTELLKKLEKVVKDHDLVNESKKARKKSLRLVIVHCTSTTVALAVALIASIVQRTLFVPLYNVNGDLNNYSFTLAWIYIAIGAFYATYLSTILDLLPIILMIILPPMSAALNVNLRSLKSKQFETSKDDIKRCIKFHQDIKE